MELYGPWTAIIGMRLCFDRAVDVLLCVIVCSKVLGSNSSI